MRGRTHQCRLVTVDCLETIRQCFSLPDHLSRHDLSINESLGESAYQQVFQLIFYLTLVSFKVRTVGPNAQTDLEFWSLLPSFLLSTISLSLGQNKVLFNQPEHYNSFMNTKKNHTFSDNQHDISPGPFIFYILLLRFQAHTILADYSSSFAQKCFYKSACLGVFDQCRHFNQTHRKTSLIIF